MSGRSTHFSSFLKAMMNAVKERIAITTIVLFLFVLQVGASVEGCPDIVLRSPHYAKVHGSTCYLFVDEERYWNDARSECWNMGGEMLSIRDESTMQFIRSVLNSRQLRWFREGVWLGTRYTGGRWRWTTGEKLQYNNWAPGEPSKILGLFSVEDCALMRRSDNWLWHDYLCGSLKFHYNYICEFPFNSVGHHESHSGAQTRDNGNLTVLTIILCSGGIVLLILLVVFIVVRQRYNYKKLVSQPDVHYDNRSYDLAVRQPAAPTHSSRRNPPPPTHLSNSRPSSNVYTDSSEMGIAVLKPNGTTVGHLKKSALPVESASTSLSCSDEDLGACGGEPSREAKPHAASYVLPPSGETEWSQSPGDMYGVSDNVQWKPAQKHSNLLHMNGSSPKDSALKPVAQVTQGMEESGGGSGDDVGDLHEPAAKEDKSSNFDSYSHTATSKSSDNLYEDFL